MRSADETDRPLASAAYLEYVLVASDEGDAYTPFQGFGSGITSPAFPDLMQLLAVLPVSPFEVFESTYPISKLRSDLSKKISCVVGPATFSSLHASGEWNNCIPIVIGLPSEIESVIAQGTPANAILVTPLPLDGAISLAGHEGHFAQFLDAAIKEKLVNFLDEPLRLKLNSLQPRRCFPEGIEPSRAAGVTLPNETLCMSLGYSYSGNDPIAHGGQEPYVEAITASFTRAQELIGEIHSDIVLYAPSIISSLYDFQSSFWNSIMRKIPSKQLREIVKDGVFRNKNYSGHTVKSDDAGKFPDPFKDEVVRQLIGIRQTELRLTSASIAVLAANGLQPAIRLPNSVNFQRPALREIERHAKRDDARGRRLLQQSYINLVNNISNQISPALLEKIRDNAQAITVVADAPIEWIRIEGLPMMIRNETSRIGMTPGNLMLQQCVTSGLSMIPWGQLDDVLVLRSFSENDPVRPVLERSTILFGMKRLRVHFVDIYDRASLVASLNAFQGMLLIFDCHGDHGGGDSHGWLQIGHERVDPWGLAGEARVPPIVVLSACSTFAIAGSHASVANGLLRSGAVTVLGTFLPVNAELSAMFVARLLYRIDAFLPVLKEMKTDLVTWRSLVSTFLRMSYASDLLHFFVAEKQWISEDCYEDLGLSSNLDINQLRPDWYKNLIERFSKAANRSPLEIQNSIDHECPLQETMYYCQIGRPETIVIDLRAD